MSTRAVSSLVFVLLAAATPAWAVIYTGNPDMSFRVDRTEHDFVGGDVYLQKFRMHYCGGGYSDYTVNASVDPAAGYNHAVSPGDYCGITFFWGSSLEIEGANNAFLIDFDATSTYLQLGTPIPPATLAPFDVVSGNYSGSNPKLSVIIQ
jgi:hypothetical protein